MFFSDHCALPSISVAQTLPVVFVVARSGEGNDGRDE